MRAVARRSLLRDLWRHRALYIMVAVPLTFLLLFRYLPMYGVQIAFRNYQPLHGIRGSAWVGLKYVHRFVESYQFWRIMRNTLMLGLYGLAVFPCSLLLALCLNYLPSRRFQKTVQTVSYLPHFISTVVMCSIILQFFDARTGLFNALSGLFGRAPVNYMGRPEHFYSIYTWTGVWQGVGYSSIIYIAALAGISQELHEAAIVDGANILKRIWHVDIPGVLPTFSILLVMRCGSLLSVGYEKVLLLQNSLNISASEIIDTYVYKLSLASSMPQYSYSAAIGLFVALINLTLLFGVNRVTRALGNSSLW